MITKDFITKTEKAYSGTAKLKIEGNKLVLRNIHTNVIHPFGDGEKFKVISKKERVNLSIWGIKL